MFDSLILTQILRFRNEKMAFQQAFGELNSAILAAAAPLDFDGLLSKVKLFFHWPLYFFVMI